MSRGKHEWRDIMDASGKLRAYQFESEAAVKQMFRDHYRWLGPVDESGYPEGARAVQFPGAAEN
jgi:hypothetical protein